VLENFDFGKDIELRDIDSYNPYNLVLEADIRCNAKCPWCYRKDWNRGKDNLKRREIGLIFSQAKKLGIHALTLTGGEPTFNKKRFRRIVEISKNYDFDEVYLITNAFYAISVEEAEEYQKGIKYLQISISQTLNDMLEKNNIKHITRVANAVVAAIRKNIYVDLRIFEEGLDFDEYTTNLEKEITNILKKYVSKGDAAGVGGFKKTIVEIRENGDDFEKTSGELTYVHIGVMGGHELRGIGHWSLVNQFGKFAQHVTPCRDHASEKFVNITYGLDGIHPCCVVYYQKVKFMTREEVKNVIMDGKKLKKFKECENILEKAITIGKSPKWLKRYEKGWKCGDCKKLSERLHPKK